MPHCLFIRCQKSLCLFGDSDSNLILFILWRGISSFGEKGGGESLTHRFLLSVALTDFSFFLIAVCSRVKRQITKTVILQEPFTNSTPQPRKDTDYILLTLKVYDLFNLHYICKKMNFTASRSDLIMQTSLISVSSMNLSD